MTWSIPKGYEDQFGKKIADSTQNELDIASHYPYSPERWRIFVDGTRQFPEHTGTTVSQYNHNIDIHELIPQGNETVVFETTERIRYVVQYELALSWAFSLNRELQGNEQIRVGFYDGTDGWFIEQTSAHNINQVDIVSMRNGTKKFTNTITLPNGDIIHFTRIQLNTNWYNVGGQIWTQTYTQQGYQYNKEFGRTSIDDGTRGPQVGNLPLRFEVTGDSVSPNLIMNAGSVGASTLGDVSPIVRIKAASFTNNVGSTNTWVPLQAIRNTSYITNIQLSSLVLLNFGGTEAIELSAQAFDPSEVTFTGNDSWSTPNLWNPTNSVLEERNDVDQFTQQDGTLVTNTTNPGGYQVGHSIIAPSGNNFKDGTATGTNIEAKRLINSQDYIIILAKSSDTGNALYEIVFEEEF